MKARSIQTWLALGVLAVGLLVAGLAGMFVYMSNTPPLHPNPHDVPSVTRAAPPEAWAGAAEEARQIVRTGLIEQSLPGLSVAVGAGGDLVWAEGFGWADLENRTPVAPETRFRIGTASTVLTSAAVGLLLEQERLRLDERIQAYVPEFPEQQWPVTLRQVMGHTAGVRNDGGDEGPLLSEHCDRPADGVRHIAEYPLLFEPGTGRRYSSYGWILVSAAVEAAAGEPFLPFMRRQVFEPLGMHDTKAGSMTDPVPNQATSYFPRFGADPRYGLHLLRPLDHSCYAGAGVFLSTPSDLVRFGLAMSAGTLLQPATVQELQLPQQLASGEDGTVLGGRVASLITIPDHGVVVALIANISYADTKALALRVAQTFADRGRGAVR